MSGAAHIVQTNDSKGRRKSLPILDFLMKHRVTSQRINFFLSFFFCSFCYYRKHSKLYQSNQYKVCYWVCIKNRTITKKCFRNFRKNTIEFDSLIVLSERNLPGRCLDREDNPGTTLDSSISIDIRKTFRDIFKFYEDRRLISNINRQ